MNRIYHLLVFFLLAMLFSQCQKEVSFALGNETQNTNPDPINSVLQGNVVDENGKPAMGVTIKVGAKTTSTNARGYFRIASAPLDKKASLVTAEKAGYFKAYRSFSATSGANQVMIKLIKKIQAGSVSGTTGGEVILANGSKIALPANGVVKAGGSVYTGTVRVFASYIDPTASDIAQTVPGSFMANDKDNNRVTLESYGMMAVELASDAGEKLQVAQGSAATLTSPIPVALQASAPATISLWFVDEQTGIWKEEGKAVKNGNNYVGEVKHFSFWNCDISIPAITLSLTLKTNEGVPVVHSLVRITRVNNPFSQTYGYTDSLGQVSGYVPQNESFVMDVLDNCNNSIYNQNIGPFAQNTDLGVITVSANTGGLVTIKGRLLNCSGSPVSNGYSIINFNNFSYYAATDATGNFSRTFTVCSTIPASAQVLGIDAAAQQQGSVVNLPVTSPVTNAGSVSACGSSTLQYINYTLDDTLHSISSLVGDTVRAYPDSLQGSTGSQFMGYHTLSNEFISFGFNATGAGTFPIQMLQVDYYNWNNTLVQPFNVVITNYPLAFSEYWEGSFSGNFVDFLNNTHSISASFRIRKQ